MPPEVLLTDLLAALQTALVDLARYEASVSLDRLKRDGDVSRMVRQALQEAIQSSLDIGERLLAESGAPPPQTYRAVFERLATHAGLDPSLAADMSEVAGLRNVLVHIYAILDLERIHRAYTVDRGRLERYAAWAAGGVSARMP